MKCKVIKVGYANVKEAEAKINEELKKIDNFVSMKVVNNGQHSSLVVFYDGADSSVESIIPQVKLVEFAITDTAEAEADIEAAFEDIDSDSIISTDFATPIDGSRLIILYDATPAEETA